MNSSTSLSFQGPIHLIDEPEKVSFAVDRLKDKKFLGFDTESRPSFKKGESFSISLLQLSTEEDAFLFRTHKIGPLKPLFSILENPLILKVGLAIHDDLKGLARLHPLRAQNMVDLQTMAKERGHTKLGMKSLVESCLQADLSKKVKLTNWEANTLTEKQLIYAATDAWISLLLFHHFKNS